MFQFYQDYHTLSLYQGQSQDPKTQQHIGYKFLRSIKSSQYNQHLFLRIISFHL